MGCRKLKSFFHFSGSDLPSGKRISPKTQTTPENTFFKSSNFSFLAAKNNNNKVPLRTHAFMGEKNHYKAVFRKVPIDPDGNLLSDGKQSYMWNGENRLITITKTDDYKLEFKYDYMGRRIEKKTYSWIGSWGDPDTTEKFAWSGWQLIGVFNSSDVIQRSYC